MNAIRKKIVLLFLLCLVMNPSFAGRTIYAAPMEKIKKLVLITGCARSGTYYISRLLWYSGLEVRHEAMGDEGMVSWTNAVETDDSPYGPPSNMYEYAHIFHQVRHPLRAISSIAEEANFPWKFICKHIPEITMRDPVLVRSAKYWYYWNLEAEKKAEFTFRVEDIHYAIDEIALRLGKKLNKSHTDNIPKDINASKHRYYTWNDLKDAIDRDLYMNIVNMASRYGYDVNDS